MKERWKKIPDSPGYLVSNLGGIKREDGKSVYIRPNSTGYLRYSIKLSGRWREKLVHRAVLTAFVGPKPDGLEAAHLNGDRTDNRLENLRWVTRKENHDHKKIHGTDQVRERHPGAKLTEEDVAFIRRSYKRTGHAKSNSRQLAEKFGIIPRHVRAIVRGDVWKIKDSCE